MGKTLVAQLVRNFSPFVGTEKSLPCSQNPATGPSPEPNWRPSPASLSYSSLTSHACLGCLLVSSVDMLLSVLDECVFSSHGYFVSYLSVPNAALLCVANI
jgi:hypothetical protein